MRVLFLGETHRADAQTWIKGLEKYGNALVETYELQQSGSGIKKLLRTFEWLFGILKVKILIKKFKPDIVLAERVTSYGFLAAISGHPKVIVAQQGITDIYPENSLSSPFKAMLAKYTFNKALLIHAWGEVMVPSMIKLNAKPEKILILPKGIDLSKFYYLPEKKDNKRLTAVVTRSLYEEYGHDIILKAFDLVHKDGIPFNLIIIGEGPKSKSLQKLSWELGINRFVKFTGSITNENLPSFLVNCNLYVSAPITEGVSASLLEAMACGCFPIVSNLPANRAWITHGKDGFLFPQDDFSLLANYIEKYFFSIDSFQIAIMSNYEKVVSRASFQKNMVIIAEKYKEIIQHN